LIGVEHPKHEHPPAPGGEASPSGHRPEAGWMRRRRIAAALAAVWLLSGVYIVGADQQAVVTRFGKVVGPRVMPGMHVSLPWPVDRVTKLKVQQLQRLVIGGELSDGVLGRTDPAVSQFLTGDQNLIHLRVVAHYSVGDPAQFLFRAEDVAQLVRGAVEAELSHRVANRPVDAVLTTEKAAIQEEVRGAAQGVLDGYGVGVLLAGVNIEMAQPPPEAADAFRDVAGARADAARIVNEAQGHTNDVIPRARGEAQRMLAEAEGYRQSQVNQALGNAARFTQVAREYERAREVNGRRLYAEAMEQVLPRVRKLVVDRNGNLDLTIIRQGEAGPPRP
jgi:membrane protease subunit HflK